MAVPNTNLDQISAITNEYFMGGLPDLVHRKNPVLNRLHAKGTTPSSGDQIRIPLIYQVTQDGAYRDYERGSTDAEDQITAAQFPWKLYRQHVTLSRPELLRNDGPEGIFKILKAKRDAAASALRSAMGDALYVAASGDSVAGLNSLDNLLGDGTIPGSGDPTIAGGIDKATYTWWRGSVNDYGAAVLATDLNTLWFDIVDGSEHPNLIISDNANLAVYWAILDGNKRFVNMKGDAGFTQMEFNGVPWVADRHCPTDHVYMLDTEHLDLVSMRGENFRFDGFQKPTDQNVSVGWIYWMGNVVTNDPRKSGFFNN